MRTRSLSLKRETLTELTTDELAALNGAVPPPTPVIRTLPLNDCVAIVSLSTCIPTLRCTQ